MNNQTFPQWLQSGTTGRKPIDIILAVGLAILLLRIGIKWAKSGHGWMAIVGGVILVLLFNNISQTAPFWGGLLDKGTAALSKLKGGA